VGAPGSPAFRCSAGRRRDVAVILGRPRRIDPLATPALLLGAILAAAHLETSGCS